MLRPVRQSLQFYLCGCLLIASDASGVIEYRLGDEEGNPWEVALAEEDAGVYQVFDAQGTLERSARVTTVPSGAGGATMIEFLGTSIRPRFIDPMTNLMLTDPEARDNDPISLPFTGGNVWYSRRCTEVLGFYETNRPMFDGNPTTANFQNPTVYPGLAGIDIMPMVVDFGADMPVNRIRFYPRLGTQDDLPLIQGLKDPKPPPEEFGEASFAENFLDRYEIRVADSSHPLSNGPCDRDPDKGWIIDDSTIQVFAKNGLPTVLLSESNGVDVVEDMRFPFRSIRWMTLRAKSVRGWEIAEFEVYGEGYVRETVFKTRTLDFGRDVLWDRIRWSGEVPEGTGVQIRTRSGSTPDPRLYFTEDANGYVVPITAEEFVSLRFMENQTNTTAGTVSVEDRNNWSAWSSPYDFEAGLRNSTFSPEVWKDGTSFLSLPRSRYIQIEIKFRATLNSAPRLDELTLRLEEDFAADEIVGEVWPSKVNSFEPTTFTYVVSPTLLESDEGFDRLEILTHARVDTIRSIKVDGVDVDRSMFPPIIQEDRVVVGFPKLKGEKDSAKQIEVVFDVSVLRFGTEFRGGVFTSTDPDRFVQQIKPGNATFRFSGNTLSVTTPLVGDLLVNVDVSPNPFTPNGDGINEAVTIAYGLRDVTENRVATLQVLDLAGMPITELPPIIGSSGQFHFEWNGHDGSGVLVPPGTYVYRLALKVERGDERTGIVSVVY